MSTKDSPSSSSPAGAKPPPTANTKPNRLPAPTLFVGPPSRNASQLSVSRQGIDTGTKTRDPLTRQRTAPGRSAESTSGKDAGSGLRKASDKEAEAKWREMQSTLNEVELSAQSSTHVFGASHAAALDELRRAQVELARAWGRGNEDKASQTAAENEARGEDINRFGNADEIARDRAQIGVPRRARGDTETSASTVLSDESGSTATGGARSQLEDETAQDIRLASERRAANEAYFRKVDEGVKEVVAKLEVVAEAMRGVEGESRSLWSQSTRSSGSERLAERRGSGGSVKVEAAAG